MVILQKDLAADFEQFCRLNPQSCPLLAVLPPGSKEPITLAKGADITTDLPKYRIYRGGRQTEEVRQTHLCVASLYSLFLHSDTLNSGF